MAKRAILALSGWVNDNAVKNKDINNNNNNNENKSITDHSVSNFNARKNSENNVSNVDYLNKIQEEVKCLSERKVPNNNTNNQLNELNNEINKNLAME